MSPEQPPVEGSADNTEQPIEEGSVRLKNGEVISDEQFLGDLDHLVKRHEAKEREEKETVAETFTPLPKTKSWTEFFGVSPDASREELDKAVDESARRSFRYYEKGNWEDPSHQRRAVIASKKVTAMLDAYKASKTVVESVGDDPEPLDTAIPGPEWEEPFMDFDEPDSPSKTSEVPKSPEDDKDVAAETIEGEETSPEEQEKLFTEKIAATSTLAELYAVLDEIGNIEGPQGTLTAEELKDSIEKLCALGKADPDRAANFWVSSQGIYTERYGLRDKVEELYKKEVATEGVITPEPPSPDVATPVEAVQNPEVGPPMPTIDQTRGEYARAVLDMEGKFKGVRSLTSMLGRRKNRLCQGIEKASGSVWAPSWENTGSLEERLRNFKVNEEDIPAAVQVLQAREAHVAARAAEAQKMLAEKEGILRASGMPEELIKTELATFKATELFDRLIVQEQALLDQAKIDIWPPKKKSAAREMIETMHKKWSALPRAARIGITTGLFTIAAFGMGAFAATGAIGAATYMSGKTGRSLASGALAQGGMWGGGKTQEVLFGKRNKAKAAEEAKLAKEKFTAEAPDLGAWRSFIDQTDKHHQKSLEILRINKRNNAIAKGLGGLLVAGGSAVASQEFAERLLSGVHISPDDIAHAGAVPSENVLAGTQENAASIHDALPDAPDPRAAAAVGESIEHLGVSPESIPSVIIQEHGNVWNSAKELQEQLDLSDKEFADAWANSKVRLPDGQEVSLSGLDLVHKDDVLSWNAVTKQFEFDNASHIDHGEILPGEGKSAAGFREMSIKEVVAADNDGLGPTIEVTDPYANLDPNAPVEGMTTGTDMSATPEAVDDQSWRERPSEAVFDQPSSPTVEQLEKFTRTSPRGFSGLEDSFDQPSSPTVEQLEKFTRTSSPRIPSEQLVDLRPGTPEFESEAILRAQTGVQDVFGERWVKSPEWNSWRGESARAFLRIPESRYTEGSSIFNLHHYVQELADDTKLEPRFGFFRKESIEHFIERAERERLLMSVKGISSSK
jgi:hypothetical protein